MTLETIRATIASMIFANWSTVTEIGWPNTTYIPPEGGTWIEPKIQTSEPIIGELGTIGVSVRPGVLSISVFTPPNSGTKIAIDYAQRLEALFRRAEMEGIIFNEPYSTDMGLNENGYYQILMQVGFNTFVGE